MSGKPEEVEMVKLACELHGEIGEMENTYIGLAQIDHDEIFGCMGPFTIIPAINAIVENIVEKNQNEV